MTRPAAGTLATVALLFLVLQVPSLRPIAKHAAALAPVLGVAALVGATFLQGWLVARSPTVPGWTLVGGLLAGVLAVSVLVYPAADALKAVGQGSDQDDALIQAATALLAGADPYGAPSYLGLPISAGPGLVIAAAPFVAASSYPGLVLVALGLACALLARAHGGAVAGRFALLLASAPAFWELVAIGSDMLAVGAMFLSVSLALDRVGGRWGRLVLAVLAGAAATFRLVFLYLPILWPLGWLARRPGEALAFTVVGLTTALALHAGFAAIADRPYPPLHLLGKGGDLLAGGRIAFALLALVGLGAAAWVGLQGKALAALAFGLAGPMAAMGFAYLAAVGWALPLWSGASYLGLAMPAVAAWAAVGAAGPSFPGGERPLRS